MELTTNTGTQEHSSEVLSILPQKPPFLFVNKVNKRNDDFIEASYTVTGNEYFLKGHFPGRPIVPGVILCEMMFQTAGLLMGNKAGNNQIGVVVRINQTKFKNFVRPNDHLSIEVKQTDRLANTHQMEGKILCNESVVCQCSFTCALVDGNQLGV